MKKNLIMVFFITLFTLFTVSCNDSSLELAESQAKGESYISRIRSSEEDLYSGIPIRISNYYNNYDMTINSQLNRVQMISGLPDESGIWYFERNPNSHMYYIRSQNKPNISLSAPRQLPSGGLNDFLFNEQLWKIIHNSDEQLPDNKRLKGHNILGFESSYLRHNPRLKGVGQFAADNYDPNNSRDFEMYFFATGFYEFKNASFIPNNSPIVEIKGESYPINITNETSVEKPYTIRIDLPNEEISNFRQTMGLTHAYASFSLSVPRINRNQVDTENLTFNQWNFPNHTQKWMTIESIVLITPPNSKLVGSATMINYQGSANFTMTYNNIRDGLLLTTKGIWRGTQQGHLNVSYAIIDLNSNNT